MSRPRADILPVPPSCLVNKIYVSFEVERYTVNSIVLPINPGPLEGVGVGGGGGCRSSNEPSSEINKGGLKTQTFDFQLLVNTGGMKHKFKLTCKKTLIVL